MKLWDTQRSSVLAFLVVSPSFCVAKKRNRTLFKLLNFQILNFFFFSVCILSLKHAQGNLRCEQGLSPDLMTTACDCFAEILPLSLLSHIHALLIAMTSLKSFLLARCCFFHSSWNEWEEKGLSLILTFL